MPLVVCPLRWFFCLLGRGSFHFVPCIPPLFGCFGLYLIGRVSSRNHFVPLMDPRVESCIGFEFGFSSILPHLLLSLESCFPPLKIAPLRSFAQETPEVGQTLTSTLQTHNAGCMYGDKITFIQSLSLYIHYIHCNLVPQQTMVG